MDAHTAGLPGQTAAPVAPAAPGLAAITAFFEDPTSLRDLLKFCLFHLGDGATDLDAEDALHEFYASRGQKVFDTFKPGGQSLRDYFKYCLKRFCWPRGKKLRERINSADPVAEDCEYGEDGSVGGIPIPETREDWNPELKLLAEERDRNREAELSRVRAAIGKLPRDDQRLLRLLYPQETQEDPHQKIPYPAAAQDLHITPNAAKVRHFRAIRRLRRILKVKNGG